jgi:hypothetical protein
MRSRVGDPAYYPRTYSARSRFRNLNNIHSDGREQLGVAEARRQCWAIRVAHFWVTNNFVRQLSTAARAYRGVTQCGHLCQTFCVVATCLGLAPFCTAALKDTLIEEDLGIDGIRESILYVAGVGLSATSVRARQRFSRSADRHAASPSKDEA